MIKAVVFDLDGTLVDAKEWHFEALNEALRIFGFEITEEDHVRKFDGLPTRNKLELLSIERGLSKGLFEIIGAIKQERTLRLIAQGLYPRIEQVLLFQWLRSHGYQVGIATNSIFRTASQMVQSAGLEEYLDVLLSNEDVVSPKPHPEIYKLAAKHLGRRPEECLAVEDNHYGIQAARAAGFHVLQVGAVSEVRIQLLEKTILSIGKE